MRQRVLLRAQGKDGGDEHERPPAAALCRRGGLGEHELAGDEPAGEHELAGDGCATTCQH